jgi:hypothetical protein
MFNRSLMECRLAEISESDDYEAEDEERPRYAFPDLDKQIRSAVDEYGAVFPKLNFSSPRVSESAT